MLIAPPTFLVHLVKPWASFYGDSKVAATIVVFLHIAPIIVGGGIGIALDRATLRVARHDEGARRRHLAELATVHRWVIGALVTSFISGTALLASDLETFFGSWIFWAKMALIVLLLANGAVMTMTERALGAHAAGSRDLWGRLRTVAVVSLTLWLVITFAGVALTNVA